MQKDKRNFDDRIEYQHLSLICCISKNGKVTSFVDDVCDSASSCFMEKNLEKGEYTLFIDNCRSDSEYARIPLVLSIYSLKRIALDESQIIIREAADS